MTSKERMIVAMKNGQPDMVPVSPDISNMIPCKLTGKPFWDIYLFKNPPLWKAYIDAVNYFGFDGWLTDDADVNTIFDADEKDDAGGETVIVHRDDERIITREYTVSNGKKEWSKFVTVYQEGNPPTTTSAENVGLHETCETFEPIEGVCRQNKGVELLREVMDYMGSAGVVAIGVWPPHLGMPEKDPYSIYEYTDKYDEVKQWSEKEHVKALEKLERILSAEVKPDFILTGGSGLLIFNTPDIVRELTLPTLKEITRICKKANMPTQVHCCGPSMELIRMCAEETELDSMNPLEIPPMGDCDLAEVKKLYGHRLSLMGNLHTTDVMLRGMPGDVEKASKKAIDDAAKGGGFVLSTGDQCGRDTPFENIRTMIDVARSYGRY